MILDGASSLAIETHCVPDGMRGDFLADRLAKVAIAIGVDDGVGSDVSPDGAKTLTKAVPVNGSTTTLRNPVSTAVLPETG